MKTLLFFLGLSLSLFWNRTEDCVNNVRCSGTISRASRIIKGEPWYDVKAYGAVGNGVSDDTSAIQNAITAAHTNSTGSGVVFFPHGTYRTTGCIQTYHNIWLKGTGRSSSIIVKSTNAVCAAGSVAAPGRVNIHDNYNAADAIIAVVHPANDYAYHWKITGLYLKNSTARASKYGIYSPRSSQFDVSDDYISNVGTGFYANDDWLGTIRHVTVDTANFGYRWADDGSGNETGTTLTLDNTYANNIALSCYNIFGLNYSSFNNTACDNLNVNNRDNAHVDLSYAAYGFTLATNITLNGAGSENVHGTVLSSQSSTLTVNAMRALSVVGYTSASRSPAYILVDNNGSVDLTGSTFDAMTSPGSFFNLLTQLGGQLTARSTLLPTGGNAFNSFSAGSSIVTIDPSTAPGSISMQNSSGTTFLDPTTLSLGGKITSYQGVGTVSRGVPSEIATVDITRQTAAVATRTLYAVPAGGAGQYRFTWNSKLTTAATTSSTLGPLTITYTDPDGVAISLSPAYQVNGGGTANNGQTTNNTSTVELGFSVLLNCKANTKIQYSFAYASSGATTMQYNLHITLEAM